MKHEEESYLQLLQGLLCNRTKLQKAYTENNLFLIDLLDALKRKQQGAICLEAEVKALRSHLVGHQVAAGAQQSSTKSRDRSATAAASTSLAAAQTPTDGTTAVLRVSLKQSGRVVLLFKGQWVRTPMGDGQILCLRPESRSAEIQLPFGKMYAAISRLVCWQPQPAVGKSTSSVDVTDDVAIGSKWKEHGQRLVMPTSKRTYIRRLLGPANAASAAIDAGYASGDAAYPNNSDEESDVGSESDDEGAVNGAADQEGPVKQPTGPSNSNVNEQQPQHTAGQTSTANTRGAARNQLLANVSVFPLSSNATSAAGRSNRSSIRKNIVDDVAAATINTDQLALTFAPAG